MEDYYYFHPLLQDALGAPVITGTLAAAIIGSLKDTHVALQPNYAIGKKSGVDWRAGDTRRGRPKWSTSCKGRENCSPR